ncbi:MAG TPA: septation regulator SpoVG [Spirochaetota bacterium]|nr:septation regulator SpoVG [Spirochaetota bacterium]
MEITDIRLKKIEGDGSLQAYAAITFDDCFVIHNIKVIKGHNGLFIAMPRRKTRKGEYKDIAHPINSEFRGILQSSVLEAFNNYSEDKQEEKES